MSDFEKRIKFQPGYNHLHETGPKRRGQHGMEIAFALIGAQGAISFEFNTMWTPLGPVDGDSSEAVLHTDYSAGRYDSPCIFPPSAKAVYIHWGSDFPDNLGPADGCGWLDGGTCWGDATFTGSDPILRDFIKEGEGAVWRHLTDWYQHIVERASAVDA